MKLIIFGSTGNIGSHLVLQALKQGHAVSAFTRSPEKIDQEHNNLQIIAGDVLDPRAVNRATARHDAVLCALGMPLMNSDNLRARGTKNIVRAMEETGVKRLICLSSLGAGDSRSALPGHYRYLLFPVLMRRLLADHNLQERYIKNSRLDWTVIRPANYTDGKQTGSYKHGFIVIDKSMKLKISHADVAHFMLRQLRERTYLHKAPSVSC